MGRSLVATLSVLVVLFAATTVTASTSGSAPTTSSSFESAKSVQESSFMETSTSVVGTPKPPTTPAPPTPAPSTLSSSSSGGATPAPDTVTIFTVTLKGGQTGTQGQEAVLAILKSKFGVTASEVEFTNDPDAPKGSISFVFKTNNKDTRAAANGLRAAEDSSSTADSYGFSQVSSRSAPITSAPSEKKGLSTGVIAAIAVGAVVVVVLIGAIVFKVTRPAGGTGQHVEDPMNEELTPSKRALLNEDHYKSV